MGFEQLVVLAGCLGVSVMVYRRLAGPSPSGASWRGPAKAAREAEALGLLPASRQKTLFAGPAPELEAALQAAARGDWGPAARLMAATRERRDWQRRHRYAVELGELAGEGDGAWLDAWEAAGPDDPDVAVVRVEATITLAWLLRGTAWAKDTTDAQIEGFLRVLPQARPQIERAAELNPQDPTPYISETKVALGLNYPHEAMHRVWKDITTRAPHHYGAHLAALLYWARKWHGSEERAASFARDAAASAPPGALLRMLPLVTWWEHHDGSGEKGSYRTPELVAQVDAALADVAAARPDDPDLPGARHLLAYFLTRQGRYEAALEQFRLVDGHVGAAPWACYGDPAGMYCRWRDKAVRGARGRGRGA
ncbi:hypothetical protein I3F58_19995 [Streptomyces sp. MUM 203J]|uniref:hypothetical protein n=1 Tax=Streptomyces sp. MUM 203J TaxID=2791990 RepID=UPI001F04291A|nr:hypothetical protein [Streptomyces sp. MUM 203J]MCH0541805.1 hypothetical protein [Streptomyces sp. MUM 203J]